jgi:DNA adenine methylase
VRWIIQQVELPDAGTWIEPFTGSGVVGFNLRPKRALFADINPHIVNFYNAVKSGQITPATAKAFLEHEGQILSQKGESHYYEVRNRFNKHGAPLDFLFLSRAGFNGVIRFNKKGEHNVPFGHKPQRFAKAYVTKITNQIKYVANAMKEYDWNFVCADFRTIIPQAKSGDFLYCDPPYSGRHTDYFNSWSDGEEQQLYSLLASTPAKFILSTWHSNQYRTNLALEKYASDFKVLTREHFYHVGANEDNRNPMLEAIVLNYSPASLEYQNIEQREKIVQLQLLESR